MDPLSGYYICIYITNTIYIYIYIYICIIYGILFKYIYNTGPFVWILYIYIYNIYHIYIYNIYRILYMCVYYIYVHTPERTLYQDPMFETKSSNLNPTPALLSLRPHSVPYTRTPFPTPAHHPSPPLPARWRILRLCSRKRERA